LQKYGYTASVVEIGEMLHLKTGINYIGNRQLVMIETLLSMPGFEKFNKIGIPENEAYAANCVLINDYLLIAKGFEMAKKSYVEAGYKTIELDMSEYQKLDGGLSCLSLRF
jgi:dimethylargininase